MPRKSPYTIKLTRKERVELMERSRQYTSIFRQVIRAKIVLLASKGLSNDAIAARLRARWPNIVLVHTPVHASWLNQIEVYFSIVQRKLLTPNDFRSLTNLRRELMNFQNRYEQSAKPFEWTFTRRDLEILLARLDQKPDRLAA